MSKTAAIIASVAVAGAGLAGWVLVWRGRGPAPAQARPPAAGHGGLFRAATEGFSGCGWSVNPTTGEAIREALADARGGRDVRPAVTLAFYTRQHVPEQVAQALRAAVGPEGRFLGWSSDFGVLAPDGYHDSETGALGLLCLTVPSLRCGVGYATLEETGSAAACARLALKRAVEQSGADEYAPLPSAIIMTATYDGMEEVYLEVLTQQTSPTVPILGGTAAGSAVGGAADASVVVNGAVVRKGLALAVFYSPLPFGWAFRGGFDRTGKSGMVTRSDGRAIWEIDDRPALEVYDEWSGGRVSNAMRAGKDMNTFTGLYPLCRPLGVGKATHNLFVHAWPPEDAEGTRRLVTSANLWPGDVVHFSEGSWNILLNRLGALPREALEGKPDLSPAAGLLVCCEAVLKNIPANQRDQIAFLINRTLGRTPWIGMFTWGEQGNFSGVGNYHGNLLTSITLFPGRKDGAPGQ